MSLTSARNGAEFPEYAASKGGHGRIYEKRRPSHCSLRGDGEQPFSRRVTTPLNDRVMRDKTLWDRIMAQTLLIDNGEQAKAEFIW